MQTKAEALPLDAQQQTSRRLAFALTAFILFTAAMRVWIIAHYPEPDNDAKGHLGIAKALLSDPFNVAVHWVWPPGFHFFLAALLAVGVDAQGVRFLNCALAALLPILVWRYAARTAPAGASRASRNVPLLAGLLCAAMPVVNSLGTSAQPGTLFAVLVLSTAWAIDAERFVLAGGLLAAATMVRYEACGAVGLLVGLRVVGYVPAIVNRLPASLARLCRLPLALVVTPLVTVVGWMLAHRIAEGTWLGFLHELYRYTHVQRESFHQDTWTELLWFPVMQPYYLFGLAIPLFFLGGAPRVAHGFVALVGIYLFLLGSYAFKGALGSARYYESVTPFVCIAAAYGASVIGERWRLAQRAAFAAAFAHVVWLLALTGRWTFHLGAPSAGATNATVAPSPAQPRERGSGRS